MLNKLYVHNFRCLENFTLDFNDRGSTLLIGKNGSGKTTIQRAMQILQSISRGTTRITELITAADFTQHRTNLPMTFKVDCTLQNRTYHYELSVEFPKHFKSPRVLSERLEVDNSRLFERSNATVELSSGSKFSLDWHSAGLPLIGERPGENTIGILRNYLSSMMLISPIPNNMSGFSDDESFELSSDASNFSAFLNATLLRHPATYRYIDQYLQSVFPDYDSFENVPRGERGKQLRVKFKGIDTHPSLVVEFSELSSGEKCFFLSALIIAYNRVAPAFCFWDEPDNHLSLDEVAHFIYELRKMSNFGGQFVATSHNSQTISSFSDENTVVLQRASHLEPCIPRLLSDIGYRGDLIDALSRNEVMS
jgi:predicted ATPase